MSMIFYIDSGELNSFISSAEAMKRGYAYEWEGEGVVHLHFDPVPHSFGERHPVLFVKDGIQLDLQGDYSYVVGVGRNAEVAVLDGSLRNVDAEVNYIPARSELYSRSKGILEVGILENKRVMIVGLGSFGSQIAIELAKAGVGKFALFDFDRVEIHNLARHTATIKDLGRLKTDVISESIKGKNPYAAVDVFPIDINKQLDLLDEEVEKADIVICATDNNESRFNLQVALIKKQKIGIFGRAVTRAEGGDVFRYRPGGPCYCCLIGNDWFGMVQDEVTNRDQLPAYMSQADADAAIQVGLSADIEPICNMMLKITLMELSRGAQSGISCLEDELVYDYYMWANRRERRHKNWAPMPGAGNRPTIMRWYGARIGRNEHCSLCATQGIVLDEGEGIMEQYGDILGENDAQRAVTPTE